MYTILQVHCSKKIVNQVYSTLCLPQAEMESFETDSWKEAKEILYFKEVHCILANIDQEYEKAIGILKNNALHATCKYHPVVFISEDKNILSKAMFQLHNCECLTMIHTPNQMESFWLFLKYHCELLQRLNRTVLRVCYMEDSKRNYRSILPQDILFIETMHHKCVIYTKQEEFSVSQPLSELKKHPALTNLVQCHRSYLVNLNQILTIDKSTSPWTIYFDNSTHKACISRTRQKEVINALSLLDFNKPEKTIHQITP